MRPTPPPPSSAFRIRYRTLEFETTDIHVRTLRDGQQFFDAQGVAENLGIYSATWPHFGVIWQASEVLAHLMFDFDIEGKRILEVGCGIALASLVLNHRLADITATDHHPEVEGFLRANTELNHDRYIPFVRTGWVDQPRLDLGLFDLVIGSDLLYERGHVAELSAFIDSKVAEHGEIILIDPGRGHHAQFSKRMVLLGYSHHQHKPAEGDYLDKPFPGQVLRYRRSSAVASPI